VKRNKNHEKRGQLLNNSPRGRLTRSGELKASKHCSLLHNYSPWRVGGEQTLLFVTHSSPWQADLLAVASYASNLSGSAIFNPKNPIFIQLNPKIDRKLNLWSFYNLNIIYLWILQTFYTLNIQFYKFYHQIWFLTLILKFTWTTTKLHVKFNFRIIPPKIREYYSHPYLRLVIARLYRFSLLLVLLFSSFSQRLL